MEIPCAETIDFPNSFLNQCKALVIPHPSLSFMAQCTLGITPDQASRILLQSLLNAKPVLGIYDDTEDERDKSLNPTAISNLPENNIFSQRIRSAMQSLRRQYARILEDWGVSWVKMDNLFSVIQKIMEPVEGGKQNLESSKPPSKRIVITQDDILEHIKKGETHWLAPSNAIITSLAWEIAKKHGFHLKLSP